MNTNEHTSVEDLALFALLLLDEEEAARVRTHGQSCALCTEELRRVQEDLGHYGLAVDPQPLPSGARDRFLAQLEQGEQIGRLERSSAVTPAAGPLSGAAPAGPMLVSGKGKNPVGRVLPWVGWAAAAAAIVVAVGLRQERDSLRAALASQSTQDAALQSEAAHARRIVEALTDARAVRVTLSAPKAPEVPSARATYLQQTGTLLLLASHLAPLGSEKVYELWLIPADGSSPVAAGTFAPDTHGNASLLVPSLHGAVLAKAFGITVEHAGGSATPTMPILLAGAPS